MKPQNIYEIDSFAATTTGSVRQTNEDSWAIDPETQLFIVADGLGGLPEGKTASNLATGKLVEWIESSSIESIQDFQKIVDKVHEIIRKRGKEISPETGIGTTLTAFLIHKNNGYIAHAGDSSFYILEGTQFKKITEDHTMEQEILKKLDSKTKPSVLPPYYKHTLTCCLGQDKELKADFIKLKLEKNFKILLCTDGITKTIKDSEIEAFLSTQKSAEAVTTELVEEANKRGGPDNATAVCIFGERV